MSYPWLPNPITIVHDQLWMHVDECIDLSMLKKGNRVKYTPCKVCEIDGTSHADLPELEIRPEGFGGSLVTSSSTGELKFRFAMIVTTGEMSHSCFLAQFSWALLKIVYQCKLKMKALRWLDSPFVQSIKILDEIEGKTNPVLNKGINGWSSVFRIEICICLDRKWLLDDCDLSGESVEWAENDWTFGEGVIMSNESTLQSTGLNSRYNTGIYVRSGSFVVNGVQLTSPGWHEFEIDGNLSISGEGTIGHISVTELI